FLFAMFGPNERLELGLAAHDTAGLFLRFGFCIHALTTLICQALFLPILVIDDLCRQVLLNPQGGCSWCCSGRLLAFCRWSEESGLVFSPWSNFLRIGLSLYPLDGRHMASSLATPVDVSPESMVRDCMVTLQAVAAYRLPAALDRRLLWLSENK